MSSAVPSAITVAGVPVSSANPLPVQPATNTSFSVSDATAVVSGTFNIAVTTNPQTFSLGALPVPMPEVGAYHLVVYQGASAQNITAMALLFQDTIGVSSTLTYPVNLGTTVTLAQGASTVAHYYGIMSIGALKNVSLQVTWAGAPSAVASGLVAQLYLLDPQAVDRTQDYISQTTYLTLAATGDTQHVAAPGAGLSIYVVSMEGSNASATATLATFKEGSGGTTRYNRFMAASGGGFVSNLAPSPWRLPANTGLYVALGGANQCYFTSNWYLAP